jgi:Sphingosine kinase and enzymes related to eukaryotic diacylglycerol kinase
VLRQRLVVAINPAASFGRRIGVGARVSAALKAAGHDVVALQEPNYELLRRETARAVDEGCDALVVVGGDGMVSLGANIVAGTGVPLGIVASGTGNDTARSLRLPVDDPGAGIQALVDAIARGPRAIDAGRVRQGETAMWFTGAVSAGFDAAVNERANRMSWPRGASRYTVALLRELLTFTPIRYRLVVDGAVEHVEAMLVSVANGRSIGGGMRITPDARLDDGMLDLFVVAPMSRLELLRVFPRVFRGTHTSLPQVRIQRVRAVRIESQGVVAFADGERLGTLPVEIEVVPYALLVLA